MAGSIINTSQRLVPGLIEQLGKKPSAAPGAEAEGDGKFADLVSEMINSVNDLQNQAGEAQQAFLNGEPIELHEVMIKAEQAGISMDLLLEIRNKLVSAYNDVVRMPM